MERHDPAVERARTTLDAITGGPPSPEFRARLARQFVTGTIPASRVPEVRGASTSRPRSRQTLWLVPVAAAAALAIVFTINRAPAWRVTSATGSGVAVIGNLPVPMNHLDQLSERMQPGVRIRVPDGATLDLMSPGNLAIHVEPGTDLVLPPAPGRWFGRRVHGEIETGELRITTGKAFHGAVLAFASPEARVEVRGTTLAVIREPVGTCVCVLEGTVAVGEIGGPMVNVEHGMRRFVFNDGRPPELAPMREAEVDPLGHMREHRP